MYTFSISKKIFNERVLGGVIYLVGAVFFNWSIATIIYLFWFEAVLIGIFTIIKIKKSEGSINEEDNYSIDKGSGKRIPMTKVFIITLLTISYFPATFFLGFILLFINLESVESQSILYGLLFMIISMIISYWIQFVWSKEYKNVSAPELVLLPFVRYLSLSIFVFIGIWISILSTNELALLCVFIVSKVIIEQYFFQWNERRIEKKKLKKFMTNNVRFDLK